jgi:hypothetical protein
LLSLSRIRLAFPFWLLNWLLQTAALLLFLSVLLHGTFLLCISSSIKNPFKKTARLFQTRSFIQTER